MKLKIIQFTFLAGLLLPLFSFSQSTGIITGTIADQDGTPVENIQLILEGTSKSATSGKKGDFRLPDVPEGRYTLLAKAVNIVAIRQTVVVKAGETVKVNLSVEESVKNIDEVIVSAAKASQYVNPVSNLATRTSVKLLETPQSIQSVPQQVIKDQQAVSVNELTKNMAGVNNYSIFMDYTIRGFRTNFIGTNLTVNGVRGVFYDFSQAPTTYNVESVEAIKGPASALYSAGGPGGIINITTKQPMATKQYEIRATYGSFDQYRLVVDATGPLDKNKKVLYRLIAGYENSNSFRTYQKVDNLYIAPSLAFAFSSRTKLLLEANYMRDRTHLAYERGLIATQNDDGSYNFDAVPLDWTRHNPDDRNSRDNFSAQLLFNHKFSEKVSFTTLARYSQYVLSANQYTSYDSPLNDSLTRIYEYYPVEFYSFNINNFAQFVFNTGKIRHTLLAGLDFGTFTNPYEYQYFDAPKISIFNPTYLNDSKDPLSGTSLFTFANKDRSNVIGGYIQDQIDLSPKLKALLSLRQDNYSLTADYSYDGVLSDSNEVKNSALLPRVGLVFLPVPTLSVFASYSESFNPNFDNFGFNIQASGGPFEPEKGIQYELGIKGEWLNKKLIPTLSFYEIDKTNILIGDPTDPTGFRKNARGRARSTGVELTLQGNISKNLSVIANYAYNNARITQDNDAENIGNLLPNAPKNMGNAWITYRFDDSVIKGLGFSAGVQYVGERVTEAQQDFILPAFTSYEAAIQYTFKRLSLSLNAYNLADTRNFVGGYNPGVLWTMPPRSFRLTACYLFY